MQTICAIMSANFRVVRQGCQESVFLKCLILRPGKIGPLKIGDFWQNKATPEGKRSLYVTQKDIATVRGLARAYKLSLPLVEILADLDLVEIIEKG